MNISFVRWCAIALVAVAGGCAGNAPAPVPATARQSPDTPTAHRYREVDGAALTTFVFSPSGAPETERPAVILLHGGGWIAGEPSWTFSSARRFAAAGFVAMPVQYRLSNDRTTPIDALADVCAALRWVRAESGSLGIDSSRVAIFGVSAGGHLAALAATVGCGNTGGRYGRGGPDALMLWSPALDVSNDGYFGRLLLGRGTAAANSPVEHVHGRMPPVHIVHGEQDTLTPIPGAQRFCTGVSALGGQCDLAAYPGLGHLLTRNLANQEDSFDTDPVARDDGYARQRAFLERLWMR